MLDKYDPAAIEAPWYERWEAAGVFHAEPDPSRPPFVIPMPPPNITGRAHMGHGSTYTPMDILTRLHRMRGDNAVWLPGQDHAAIATQNVIEKELAKEGLTRHDLGRERFIERAKEWRALYGGIIYQQFRALGFGPDWQRDRYTMDDGLSRAVVKVFVALYREGLIYRGTRLVNWCPRCGSTLSDSEVEHEATSGTLYYVRYRAETGDGAVTVATTRPETIFADVAVAVHPEDERYRALIGTRVIRPLSPAPIPVIADPSVERAFGTGALKITPGHDFTDADIGERHGLPAISVIGTAATMTGDIEAEFVGLDRGAARGLALRRLRERGSLEREEPHAISAAICYRCDTVIEPLLSKQWFVRMQPLAEPALAASREGRVRFVPERYRRTYEDWLERIRDWTISRQIWWGHRLPVWYCPDGHVTVSESAPSTCATCGRDELAQDDDTLDTWFSSSLWPFSILGWPERTPELAAWYPAQLLVTGREIIFLWVARMVMMGLHFTGDVPFSEVLITPLILDEQGRKMSKSLGNSLDPMELVQQFGADATRFAIVSQMHEGQDVRFAVAKCDEARKFCNKLWQSVRFALQSFPELGASGAATAEPDPGSWTLADRWIMHRLAKTVADTNAAYEAFDFSEAARLLYAFVWNQLCDIYIEIAKDRRPSRAALLGRTLSTALQLLHPIMPFVTEELWQHLPHSGTFAGEGPWPTAESGRADERADAEMSRLLEFLDAVRALRAVPKIPYREFRDVHVAGADPALLELLQRESGVVKTLGRAERVHQISGQNGRPPHALSRRLGAAEILLPVDGAFVEKERSSLANEIAAADAEIAALERKLASPGFTGKAPPPVVEKERSRLEQLRASRALSAERLKQL